MKLYPRQDGLALIIFVIVIALATISYYMAGLSVDQITVENNIKTRLALKQAKQALLSYAMNYTDIGGNPAQGPGNLPCPDRDNNGTADNVNCNNNLNSPGRLPFDTLDIHELRDGNGESLWYAASNDFVTWGDPNINTSSTGTITIEDADGNTLFDGASINGIVAVIISPGEALLREDGVTQVRSSVAQRIDPVNYLDLAFFNTVDEIDNAVFLNNDSDNGLIAGVIRDAANNVIVNDMFEVITYEDIAELMNIRAAKYIEDAINNYESNCGQWPQSLGFDSTRAINEYGDDTPAGEDPVTTQGNLRVDDATWQAGGCADGMLPQWFVAEQWHMNTYYAVAGPADCVGPACLSSDGGATFDKQAVFIFSGRHGLGAPTNDPADYFEGENDNSGGLDIIFDENDPTPGADDFVWALTP